MPSLCNHVNEVPNVCPCPSSCECRGTQCEPGSPPGEPRSAWDRLLADESVVSEASEQARDAPLPIPTPDDYRAEIEKALRDIQACLARGDKAGVKALIATHRSRSREIQKRLLEEIGKGLGGPKKPPAAPEGLFVVRLYDMFDGWIDISSPVTKAEADRIWNKETKNGTEKTKYGDGDYYAIFPANTRMLVTPEFLGR